jgi:hypothetical protein
MEASWGVSEALMGFPELADLLAERHRIISNDWQAAALMSILARNLDRARAILEALDFSPAAIREDLDGPGRSRPLLHSSCDLIDHASDLAAQSAALVHANERRWRVFRQRVEEIVAEGE